MSIFQHKFHFTIFSPSVYPPFDTNFPLGIAGVFTQVFDVLHWEFKTTVDVSRYSDQIDDAIDQIEMVKKLATIGMFHSSIFLSKHFP